MKTAGIISQFLNTLASSTNNLESIVLTSTSATGFLGSFLCTTFKFAGRVLIGYFQLSPPISTVHVLRLKGINEGEPI